MPMLMYRPDRLAWLNQEIGSTDPMGIYLANILIELRLLSSLLEANQPGLMKDDLQNMRVDISRSNFPVENI